MYSVLIQNQKTIQIFQEYYPLFLELFSRGEIGVCRWIESGRSVDTALPGLLDMVDGKEEWRALIVRVEDEHDMSRYKSVPGNAYDFYASRKLRSKNKKSKGSNITEAEIPLVRLTQMLGDVPAPELSFELTKKVEEGKAPQFYFESSKNQEDVDAYDKLVEQYEYDGTKPTEIILITFSNVRPVKDKDKTEDVWVTPEEINTTDFCHENRYSSNTRFVQYPYVKEGRTRKRADLFNFWTLVMMLSSTKIDPSSLQAYRLYNARVDLDKNALKECFQSKYDELIGCKAYVENEIRIDLEKRANEKHPAPDYKMSIPAKLSIPSNLDIHVDTELFHLFPKTVGHDIKTWEDQRAKAEGNFENVFRKQDRVLDESALKVRDFSSMNEDEVTPLDKYEKQDMDAELSHLFDRILKTQNALAGTRNYNSEKVTKVSDSVKELMLGRICKYPAYLMAGSIVLLCIVFFFSAFPFAKSITPRYIAGVVSLFLIFSAVLLLCEVVMLYMQRRKMTSLIDEYNEIMSDNLNVLTSDMSIYSDFVSNIVSFSRGRSFLNVLKYKKFRLEMEYDHLQKHLTEINYMSDKVVKWAEAHYIPVSTNRNVEQEFLLDFDVAPKDNRLYTFDYGKEYEVPLNYSGDTVIAPFGFIERVIISREELYDK